MVLRAPVETVLHELKSDYDIDPDKKINGKRRGVLYEEIVDYLHDCGFESVLVTATLPNPHFDTERLVPTKERMQKYMEQYNGILLEEGHACAWSAEEQKAFNPKGYKEDYVSKRHIAFLAIIST